MLPAKIAPYFSGTYAPASETIKQFQGETQQDSSYECLAEDVSGAGLGRGACGPFCRCRLNLKLAQNCDPNNVGITCQALENTKLGLSQKAAPSCARSTTRCSAKSSVTARNWGGARKKSSRMSMGLTQSQAVGVLAAVEHAGRIGLPLNRMITVHWGRLGLADTEAGPATSRLLNLMRRHAARGGWKFACVWVRECNPAAGKGSHVHILAHVPAEASAAFTRSHARWLLGATGRRYIARAWDSRRVGGRLRSYIDQPDWFLANVAVATAYLVKGALPDVADALALSRRDGGGPVIGKRAGWSECLGANARKQR